MKKKNSQSPQKEPTSSTSNLPLILQESFHNKENIFFCFMLLDCSDLLYQHRKLRHEQLLNINAKFRRKMQAHGLGLYHKIKSLKPSCDFQQGVNWGKARWFHTVSDHPIPRDQRAEKSNKNWEGVPVTHKENWQFQIPEAKGRQCIEAETKCHSVGISDLIVTVIPVLGCFDRLIKFWEEQLIFEDVLSVEHTCRMLSDFVIHALIKWHVPTAIFGGIY